MDKEKRYTVIYIDKETRKSHLYDENLLDLTEEEAENICEQWGWFYCDETDKTYWLSVTEVIKKGDVDNG